MMMTKEEYIELHTESLLEDWKVTAQIVKEVVTQDVKEMSDEDMKVLAKEYGYE
jgi:hypothetical protein